MSVVWRSDPLANPIGMEARLIDMEGEKTLEACFTNQMTFVQKVRAIWKILVGKTFSVSSIYIGGENE